MSIQQDKEHAHRNFTIKRRSDLFLNTSLLDEQSFVCIPHIAERSLSFSIVIPAPEPESMSAIPEFQVPDPVRDVKNDTFLTPDSRGTCSNH